MGIEQCKRQNHALINKDRARLVEKARSEGFLNRAILTAKQLSVVEHRYPEDRLIYPKTQQGIANELGGSDRRNISQHEKRALANLSRTLKNHPQQSFINIPGPGFKEIDVLGLSPIVRMKLVSKGVTSILEILTTPDEQFLEFSGMGPKRLRELGDKVHNFLKSLPPF